MQPLRGTQISSLLWWAVGLAKENQTTGLSRAAWPMLVTEGRLGTTLLRLMGRADVMLHHGSQTTAASLWSGGAGSG